MREQHITTSEEATRALARSFATRLSRGDIVALQGELGTGKTRFVKGVCEAFGASRHVSSPSFVILNRYEGRDTSHRPLYLYHLDLYRVTSIEEIYDLGFEEFAYGDNVTLIEWAEQLGDLLPAKRFDVFLSYGETDDERRIAIELVDAPQKSSAERKAVSGS
jgi:tRNA threonylcarbamoyladenosine biosynthesis protein TsaE